MTLDFLKQDGQIEPPDWIAQTDHAILSRLDAYAAPPLPPAEAFSVPTAVYEEMPDFMDDAQWASKDKRLEEIFAFTELERPPVDLSASVRALGLQVADFDPANSPPPLFDPNTNTAYWVGVYHDPANPDEAVTSILSINDDQARLAPVATGDFNHAHQTAEYLLKVAERTQDVGQVLDAAEGMAIATQHRALWPTAEGILLEEEVAFNPISLER